MLHSEGHDMIELQCIYDLDDKDVSCKAWVKLKSVILYDVVKNGIHLISKSFSYALFYITEYFIIFIFLESYIAYASPYERTALSQWK